MRQGNHPASDFYAVGIAGIILAIFFFAVVFGAGIYRSTVSGQEKNNGDRALNSYVLTNIKSGDAQGAVSIYDVDGNPVIAVEDGDSGYGIRIYQNDGRLAGDYGQLDKALNPAKAMMIGETKVFRVEALENNLYKVTTDAGSSLFYLRSGAAD